MIYPVTIGSCINSLQYAYQNKTKIILNQVAFPDRFEPSYVKSAWGLLYTKLMLDGSVIGGDSVKIIRVTDELIQVVCERNIINKVAYSSLNIFSDENIIGLPDPTEEVDEYNVIDVLRATSLTTPHKHKILTCEDNLVNKLHVIKENNIVATEIYALSQLNKNQLRDFDYSDTMVKFKSEHLLEQNNFKGKSIDGKRRAPITLEVIERIVRKKMDRYEETDKIQFIYGNQRTSQK